MYKPHKLIIVLSILALLIPMATAFYQNYTIDRLPVLASLPDSTPTTEPPDYTDDTKYPYYYGRLYIESVGMDVALYRDQYNKQRAVDRQDSACYFRMSNGGEIIADHNTQAFGSLIDVEVGTEARIVLQNGEVLNLVCVEVLDGINTGHGITNKSHKIQHGKYDLLMYTCLTNWQNIRICHWNFIKEE